MPESGERRRYERTELSLSVRLFEAGEERRIGRGRTVNVSPGGLLAECSEADEPAAGDLVLVGFGPDGATEGPGELQARIVRVEGRDPLRLGAELLGEPPPFLLAPRLVGAHPAVTALKQQLLEVARYDVNVLVRGESGVGKNVVAELIHRHSPNARGTLVRVHCPALPPTLLESQLFGHSKGAYTGADCAEAGLFLAADGGTLVLDEVSAIPAELQAKLLQAIEEKSFIPVGSSRTVEADVRVIATTNDDLEGLMSEGRFRADLYYRLNEIAITVPPLRERKSDIRLLADHFLRRYCRELGKPYMPVSEETYRLLRDYSWPGNVRELQNVIKRGVILGEFAPESGDGRRPVEGPEIDGAPETRTLEEAQAEAERRALIRALDRSDGHRRKAAENLDISYRTLLRRMKKYDIKFLPQAVG